MTDKTKTSDRLIARAAYLWTQMLRRPIFDNGDDTARGQLTSALAGTIFDRDMQSVADYPAALEKFRVLLIERLKRDRDMEGEPLPKDEAEKLAKHRGRSLSSLEYTPSYYFERNLGCDYGPSLLLSEVAEAAGVPVSAFPWKTTVALSYESEPVENVRVSGGYADSYSFHYAMPDGRWCISKGFGEEAATIIDAIMRGELNGLFEIQEGGASND